MEYVKALDATPGREEFAVHAGRPIRADQAGVVRRHESTEHDLGSEKRGGECRDPSQGGRSRVYVVLGALLAEHVQAATDEDEGEGERIACHEMRGHRPRGQQFENRESAQYDLGSE